MVQPILFFVLGFLSAGFLALLVAPAIWRRAVALTRRRVEASMPLSLSEIQANKDGMRAEFAMATRKLEMNIKTFREKAAEQMVEIGRLRTKLSGLESERAAQSDKLGELEKANEELTTASHQREEQAKAVSDRLADSERVAGEGAVELERLGRMYDEASFTASNRQIELAASESRLQAVTYELSALRGQSKDALRRTQEIEVENALAREAVNAGKKKMSELDQKVGRLMATLADREEKLNRRETEVERLRGQLQDVVPSVDKSREGNIEKAIGKLDAARERLEARLTTLARENKKLKTDLAEAQRSKLPVEDASVLREQMHELAAEVVHLTAMLDGEDTSIATALAASGGEVGQKGKQMMSLADRVRSLQKAASGG